MRVFLPDSRKSPSFDRRYLCADQSIERPGIGEFPQSKKDGLAAAFSDGAKKRVVTLSMSTYLVLTAAFLWWYGGSVVLGVMAAGAVLSFLHYYQMSKKEFGGITGDLAGYFLQQTELLLVAILAVWYHLV